MNIRSLRPPTHPGVLFGEDILRAVNLSVTKAAKDLGVARQTLHGILSSKSSVTPEMALKLAKFCGNTPSFWLRMQNRWDLWHEEERLKETICKIPSHALSSSHVGLSA